jgi:hypothetical protein
MPHPQAAQTKQPAKGSTTAKSAPQDLSSITNPARICRPMSINHLLLDSTPGRFYSVPIFDTRLATLAISVVVTRRTTCAARNPQPKEPISPFPVSNKRAVSPAFSDGGQHPID